MRILLLTLYFAPDPAANSVIMTELADELVALGHDVTVVTAFPHYDTNRIWDEYRGRLVQHERRGPIDIYRHYLYVPRDKTRLSGRLVNYLTFNLLSTVTGLLQRGIDIVLAPSPPLTIGLSAYVISRLRGIPYVYNVQDIYPDIAVRLGVLTNRRAIRFFRRMEDFVYRHAAAVTVLSDGFRHNLRAKHVPDAKIHVIPNFIDVDFVSPGARDNDFAAAHDLTDKFVVLYAGNVGLSQGLEVVLDAAALLSDVPDVRFLIVGNGAARDDLVAGAAARGLVNVTFLPFQPRAIVPKMYASADIALVTLRRDIGSESVPSKAYTIMASGRPLLAAVSHDAETRELVELAQCGLWVEAEQPQALADAVRALHADPAWRAQLGHNGRRHVELHHTPLSVAQQYSDLLVQLVQPLPLTRQREMIR